MVIQTDERKSLESGLFLLLKVSLFSAEEKPKPRAPEIEDSGRG